MDPVLQILNARFIDVQDCFANLYEICNYHFKQEATYGTKVNITEGVVLLFKKIFFSKLEIGTVKWKNRSHNCNLL